ncbi:kif21a protein, partial [Tribonema minus]
MKCDAVRVAVRIRPLMPMEKVQRQEECTAVVPGTAQIAVGSQEDKRFTFDFAFGTDSPQRAIYEECVTPLLEAFFEGFNATILAYGQTGSGKTYTMGSSSSARLPQEEQGILPRVITSMFDLIREGGRQGRGAAAGGEEGGAGGGGGGGGIVAYAVRCQFLEIYGEDINDLLDPTGSQVVIREGQGGDVYVHGAREEPVRDAEEMLMLLERGSLCRTTGSTLMNAHSSRRSHPHPGSSMLQTKRGWQFDQVPTGLQSNLDFVADFRAEAGTDDLEIRKSKFHFVDLAGSERAKRTGAEGQRFREGIEINKGLLTLGNVISALGDEAKRGKVHVPYRDSKLTRMLQDSLGGNSQTLMICCVSPAEVNMHETISALRYANRARNIQNKPIVNRDHNSTIIAELKAQIQYSTYTGLVCCRPQCSVHHD